MSEFDRAARQGNTELLEQLRDALADGDIDGAIADCVMVHSAMRGNVPGMILAKQWGSTDFREAMWAAAWGGHVRSLLLTISWGVLECGDDVARNIIADAIVSAARGGHPKMMRRLLSVVDIYDELDDAREVRELLRIQCINVGAAAGRVSCVEEAHGWDDAKLTSADMKKAMLYAASHDRVAVMAWMRDRGVSNYDEALAAAARNGCLAAMRVLKGWGATDFDGAFHSSLTKLCFVRQRDRGKESRWLLWIWMHQRDHNQLMEIYLAIDPLDLPIYVAIMILDLAMPGSTLLDMQKVTLVTDLKKSIKLLQAHKI